jgi:hypothetical protein
LDAFNLLAHYLSNFPGRKNLIWFSGSFPINVLPNPNLQNGFAAMENNNPEFRETINMFSRAQVAVYPVDARGLISDPSFSAATGKRNPIQSSPATFSQTQDSDHMMMSALATETGGKAFYDKNNLESAVQDAVDSGANYYSLSYSPANQSWNGNYRNIHVTLNEKLQAAGYQLAYRQGYYADGPGKVTQTNAEVTAPTVGGTAVGNIQPVSKAPEQMLAPNNMTDPVHPIKLPFVRYAIDIAAVGDDFQLPVDKDGHYTGVIEFSAFLYDNDGILLNSADKALQVNLTLEAYKQFLNGVNAHLELSVPVKDGGADFLRVGVRSASSNRIGVVEVPIDAVSAR